MRIRLDDAYDERVQWALSRLIDAAGAVPEVVDEGGADLIIGTLVTSRAIAALVDEGRLTLPDRPESMAIMHHGPSLIVAGRDQQGLMYGLLEVAEQMELEGLDLLSVRETSEQPNVAFRGMYTFLHNSDCERDWFFSRDHWLKYFELLARSRFNSFNLVTAAQTNYLAPPFPFFIEVPEHPEVTVPVLKAADRDRNLRALRMIADLATQHGLEFVLGIWQVIAWKRESRGGITQESMVDGLELDNLADYTYHATRRLLAEVPAIKGIQLRVNGESGVPEERQTEFFSSTVFKAIRDTKRDVCLDLRGWLAHAETVAAAKSLAIPMRVSTKYWAEHLGAPYQAARQPPAYSYADFLRFPREYGVSFQVWTLGSHRTFIWGDPGFVRTFAKSLDLGDGIGFEICPPLAQKGYGNEPGSWRLLKREHEYYQWEWERYWMFYILFGRLTYNPLSDDSPWQRRLQKRFGEFADLVMEAYVAASQVVSFIIRFNMSDPNMYIWPEADTGGLLDFYVSVSPSDPSQIKSFSEAAAENLSGDFTARMGPREASDHLRKVGTDCLRIASGLRGKVVDNGGPVDRELVSTAVDVEALGELALFHAEKIPAAENLASYLASGDYGALLEASRQLPSARPHWERLIAVTDGFYTDKLVTGPIDSGHWKDKLVLVTEDEQRLVERLELHRRYGGGRLGGAVAAFDFGGTPKGGYNYPRVAIAHHIPEPGFTAIDDRVRWQHPSSTPHGWSTRDTIWTIATALPRFCDRHTDTIFRDTMARSGYEDLVPFTNMLFRGYVGGKGAATFHAVVAAGHYEVIVICCDKSLKPSVHGPFTIRVNDSRPSGPLICQPGELVELRTVAELGRGLVTVTFESVENADWFCSGIVVRPIAPVINHVPIWNAPAERDLNIRAAIASPEGIGAATLHVDHGSTSRSFEMKPVEVDHLYEAIIPKALVLQGSEIRYWFEVSSKGGQVARLPARSQPAETRSFRAAVVDSQWNPPSIAHQPVSSTNSGCSVEITADVKSASPVRRVLLHYRYVNQYYDWQRVFMDQRGNHYMSEIPSDYVVPEWDLMYYLEATDDAGNSCMAPAAHGLEEIPYYVIRVKR